MRLCELTTEEVADLQRRDYTLVLPTGSTEQHGPHLPLDTDIFLAEQVAFAGADGIEALVLPSLPYGYNQKEVAFAGTVSLRATTFLDMLVDLGQSLGRQGWSRLMIVNGHGWNNDILRTAVHILNESPGLIAACSSYWTLCAGSVEGQRDSPIPGGMAHACEFETSLMLHLRPQSVRLDMCVDEISYRRSRHHHHDLFRKSPVFLPEPFDRLSESGVIGTPSLASAAKGEIWFRAAARALKEFLTDFRSCYPRAGDSP
jgi:creatinine amidohydrolase